MPEEYSGPSLRGDRHFGRRHRPRAGLSAGWFKPGQRSDRSLLRRCVHRAARAACRGVRSGAEQLLPAPLLPAAKTGCSAPDPAVAHSGGGGFIWTDLARHSQQTRDMCLKSLVHEIRQNWPALRSDEVEETVAHVLSSDFPEEEQWMLDTARECGFSLARALHRDEFYGSWAFVAAPDGHG